MAPFMSRHADAAIAIDYLLLMLPPPYAARCLPDADMPPYFRAMLMRRYAFIFVTAEMPPLMRFSYSMLRHFRHIYFSLMPLMLLLMLRAMRVRFIADVYAPASYFRHYYFLTLTPPFLLPPDIFDAIVARFSAPQASQNERHDNT